MSRIGRKPIEIPAGVSVSLSPGRVQVNGPLGELKQQVPARMKIEQTDGDVTKLTVTHELDGAPATAAIVGGTIPEAGGGWSFVLSDLKTVLETGDALFKVAA